MTNAKNRVSQDISAKRVQRSPSCVPLAFINLKITKQRALSVLPAFIVPLKG